MNETQAEHWISERVCVDHLKLCIAKAYIAGHFTPQAEKLVEDLLAHVDARTPQTVVVHDSADTAATLKKVAESLSWRLAAGEAIWGLIHSGFLLARSQSAADVVRPVSWTTAVAGSGTSSSWSFSEFSLHVPNQLALAPSAKSSPYTPLTNPDIYLTEINIPNISPEIESALREAVRCFKQELYLACLAMLGKASEAAWIEFGVALAKLISPTPKHDPKKIADELLSPMLGIGKKIADVLKLCEHPALPQALREHGDFNIKDLRNSALWADTVRDSRNSLHYGATPAMSNCYEKVGTLLIAAVPHIRLLCVLKNTCSDTAPKAGSI